MEPKTVTLKLDNTQKVDGLLLTVTEIIEKRLTDGTGEMRVTLLLKAGDIVEPVMLDSRNPSTEWQGYTITYKGGTRDEANILVASPSGSGRGNLGPGAGEIVGPPYPR